MAKGIRPSENVLRRFIKESIDKGLSANKTLERLRSIGFGMRRQEFLNFFRAVKDAGKIRDAFLSTAKEKVFSTKNYTVVDNRAMGYRSTFKVKLITGSGIEKEHFITVRHGIPLSRKELENEVRRIASNLYVDEYSGVGSKDEIVKTENYVEDVKIESFEFGTKGFLDD
jgi:hypothetical protein